MSVFDAGPWEKERAQGAHVFDRKLLYGSEHDSAEHLPEGADPSTYGVQELHKLHAFYRKNALKMMAEQVRRAPKGSQHNINKIAARSGPTVWPGDLGKHHALIEEMIKLGVVSLHQDDNAITYAKIHPPALRRAMEKFCTSTNSIVAASGGVDAAGGAAVAAASSAAAVAAATPFIASIAFAGARRGYVFKRGDDGVGYYADGAFAAAGDAAEVLPEGWVKGKTAEGYVYYWHHETSSSSWEKPTGPPIIERTVALAAAVAATLRADAGGGRFAGAVAKLEEQSGATIVLGPASAVVRGHSEQVGRAVQLLERKAAAFAFASRALPGASVAHQHQHYQQPQQVPQQLRPDYSFAGIVRHVATADASREALRQHREARRDEGGADEDPPAKRQAGGALAALAAYGDDDDDDDE